MVVTDKNSDAVKLIDKGDGKYTFTMPRFCGDRRGHLRGNRHRARSPRFTDVPASAYYYDAVLWAVENGVTEGTNATTFSRGCRLHPCADGDIPLAGGRLSGGCDRRRTRSRTCTAGAYYYDAVLWAVEQGITSGTSATTFSPGCHRAPVLRP